MGSIGSIDQQINEYSPTKMTEFSIEISANLVSRLVLLIQILE